MSIHTQENAALTELMSAIEKDLNLERKYPVDPTAWFLGPKAENQQALLELITMAAQGQFDSRKEYMPSDPPIFTGDSGPHKKSIEIIKTELKHLLKHLKGSIPLASYRNQSHMYWDITLPAAVGYFAAMLYNQNNVAAEASPVTTLLELQVGKELCEMLGFGQLQDRDGDKPIKPWGHITCDGSIANGESMWAARNLKFLPVALAAAIAVEPDLKAAKCVSAISCAGHRARLIDLSIWELLNLPIDDVIGLVDRIVKESDIDKSKVSHAVDVYSVQNIGLVEFQQRYLDTYLEATPVVLVPATAHYSWPKSAALLGLGTHAVKPIDIDLDGRMSMVALRCELDRCLRKKRPVLQVVAVMGTTEEGSIDPLAEIVRMREEYQQMGLNFVIHADAAWGGYFTSMLRDSGLLGKDPARKIDDYHQLYLSDYFKEHFNQLPLVDSVTLDPHKSGFVPYPAGSLCYRNGNMRDLITYTAPVVSHGSIDPTVGPYGIEGSKPGAAATSVYLSHKVIPLNDLGYGRLLGRCLFNSKRFYAALVTMDLTHGKGSKPGFNITPFQRLPVEKEGGGEDEVIKQKWYLKEHIVPPSTDELIEQVFGLNQSGKKPTREQQKALETFQAIGSDLSIVTYAFNFKTNSRLNTDMDLMNELNHKIFRALSLQPSETCKVPTVEMFVTASEFDPATYGQHLVDDFANRAGVTPIKGKPLKFLISTTQNPWLSTTSNDTNMIDVLIEVLRKTVNQATQEVIRDSNLDQCHTEQEESS